MGHYLYMEHYFDGKETYKLFLSLIPKISGVSKQKFREEIEATFKIKQESQYHYSTRRLTTDDVQMIFDEIEEVCF